MIASRYSRLIWWTGMWRLSLHLARLRHWRQRRLWEITMEQPSAVVRAKSWLLDAGEAQTSPASS
jgi:hypothetical protein